MVRVSVRGAVALSLSASVAHAVVFDMVPCDSDRRRFFDIPGLGDLTGWTGDITDLWDDVLADWEDVWADIEGSFDDLKELVPEFDEEELLQFLNDTTWLTENNFTGFATGDWFDEDNFNDLLDSKYAELTAGIDAALDEIDTDAIINLATTTAVQQAAFGLTSIQELADNYGPQNPCFPVFDNEFIGSYKIELSFANLTTFSISGDAYDLYTFTDDACTQGETAFEDLTEEACTAITGLGQVQFDALTDLAFDTVTAGTDYLAEFTIYADDYCVSGNEAQKLRITRAFLENLASSSTERCFKLSTQDGDFYARPVPTVAFFEFFSDDTCVNRIVPTETAEIRRRSDTSGVGQCRVLQGVTNGRRSTFEASFKIDNIQPDNLIRSAAQTALSSSAGVVSSSIAVVAAFATASLLL
jgi:hypothetical protein